MPKLTQQDRGEAGFKLSLGSKITRGEKSQIVSVGLGWGKRGLSVTGGLSPGSPRTETGPSRAPPPLRKTLLGHLFVVTVLGASWLTIRLNGLAPGVRRASISWSTPRYAHQGISFQFSSSLTAPLRSLSPPQVYEYQITRPHNLNSPHWRTHLFTLAFDPTGEGAGTQALQNFSNTVLSLFQISMGLRARKLWPSPPSAQPHS